MKGTNMNGTSTNEDHGMNKDILWVIKNMPKAVKKRFLISYFLKGTSGKWTYFYKFKTLKKMKEVMKRFKENRNLKTKDWQQI